MPNCIEGATYDPWKSLGETTTAHNYREGNLPPNSKLVHHDDDDNDDDDRNDREMVIEMPMMTITMITTAHGFLEENQPSTKSCSILMTLMFIIKHFLMIVKALGVHDTHDKI